MGYKYKKMSGIKQLLEQSWYEYQESIQLDWMEKEYFNYISRLKKHNNYDKLKEQEEVSRKQSQRPHIYPTQEND